MDYMLVLARRVVNAAFVDPGQREIKNEDLPPD
jgi:hypothetical protein